MGLVETKTTAKIVSERRPGFPPITATIEDT
jgi:hypothetical protein